MVLFHGAHLLWKFRLNQITITDNKCQTKAFLNTVYYIKTILKDQVRRGLKTNVE